MGKLSADAVGQRSCRGFRGAVGGIERITGHRRHYKERDARRRAAREIYAAPAQWRWLADPGGPAVRSFHAWRRHAFLSCSLSSLAGWPDCRYQPARSRCGGLSSGRHNVLSICWHRAHTRPARKAAPYHRQQCAKRSMCEYTRRRCCASQLTSVGWFSAASARCGRPGRSRALPVPRGGRGGRGRAGWLHFALFAGWSCSGRREHSCTPVALTLV